MSTCASVVVHKWFVPLVLNNQSMKHYRFSPVLVAAVGVLAMTTVGAAYAMPVPAGTTLSVHLVNSLSSSSASAGQTFAITAAQPLLVQGRVVVFEGQSGQGHVVAITQPSKKSKASIVVQFDWITAADGKHITLSAAKTDKGFGPLTIGAGGIMADAFAKAKSIELGSDMVFTAYVNPDQQVTVVSSS
jgi:hypothetical protein